jgi:hypothetical protein
MRKIIEKSSDGLTTSGFEKLEKSPIYLYQIRDILLDTTLLNTAFEHGLVMTSIGDNLVKDFLNVWQR